MKRFRTARLALVGTALLALSACGGNAGTGVTDGTQAMLDYYGAKKAMAQSLQHGLTGATGSTTYTLVAINGPAYPVGSLVSASNPLDLESRACQLADSDLPRPEPWSSVPSAKIDKTFAFSLNIPAPMRHMFNNADTSVAGGFNWERHSSFELSELSQVFLSLADLRGVLARPECAAALAAAEGSRAVFVRGIVYGKETLSSSRKFNPNLTVKVMTGDTGQFTLNYNNEGAFNLVETSPTAKFAIIANVKAPVTTKGWSGETGDGPEALFTRTNPETVSRIEALRN